MRLKSHHLLAWVPHLFLFYKEKVFRKLLPIMTVIALYATLIVYADKYWGAVQKIANPDLSQFHLIFSFILTIIISFRVNTSYARWWEGRTLWGSIVNNCRNLGLKFDVYVGLSNYPSFLETLHKLPSLFKSHVRRDKNALTDELQALGIDENQAFPLLLVIGRLYAILNTLRQENILRFEQYLALDVHLANLTDLLGGCERIANTPVPSAYAIFVKQALLFYSLMFPFGWVDSFGFLIIPIMIMIVYILLGLEMLSEELEEPFENEENSLRLDIIAQTIGNNILSINQNNLFEAYQKK